MLNNQIYWKIEKGVFALKLFSRLSSKKGFTLVEILIVIIIIGILVAIAIPVYSDVADTSRNTVCKYNASYIARKLSMVLYKFEPEDRYDSNPNSENGLNNLLEKELAISQTDKNSKDRIMNPVSRSKKIVHSLSDERNPAVLITGGDSPFAYIEGASNENLKGSIVVYFAPSPTYNIQIYYLDKEGTTVELLLNYN